MKKERAFVEMRTVAIKPTETTQQASSTVDKPLEPLQQTHTVSDSNNPLKIRELLTQIFSYLSPRELAQASLVSKFWKTVSDQHPKWVPILKETFNQQNLNPSEAKKLYGEYKTASSKIEAQKKGEVVLFGKKVIDSSNIFKKDDKVVFIEALRAGDNKIVITMISNKTMDVNQNLGNYTPSHRTIYTNARPIHIAVSCGQSDLIKELLNYGANIEEKVTRSLSNFGYSEVDSINALQLVENAKTSTASIMHLAFAEKMLRKQELAPEKRIEMAKHHYLESRLEDTETAQNYIQQILTSKEGYQITYSNEEINSLADCFERIMQMKAEQSSNCTIS